MKNVLIYLIGYPGTGKYTIAKEICRQADFKLVDNHLINNPVFSLLDLGKSSRVTEDIFVQVRRIRSVVFDTLKKLAPDHLNYVMTNVLAEDDPSDLEIYRQVEEVAAARKALFIPVILNCSADELKRRIVSKDRTDRFKLTDPDILEECLASYDLINIQHPNVFSLDVTEISAGEAARKILERMHVLKSDF